MNTSDTLNVLAIVLGLSGPVFFYRSKKQKEEKSRRIHGGLGALCFGIAFMLFSIVSKIEGRDYVEVSKFHDGDGFDVNYVLVFSLLLVAGSVAYTFFESNDEEYDKK
ncbi:hypothetical protein VDG1235_2214 [Verrucomicrobiia bacterium DG1235]|nr:hypothetical protein VDG1235_2214 [Verrucomicrobiae bacterium DG1235]